MPFVILCLRQTADRLFVPPHVLAARGNVDREADDDSDDETQLPKDQPIWQEQTVDNEDRQADADDDNSSWY
jgi:hypothetical protein